MRKVLKPLLAVLACAVALPALAAEMSPVGLWRTTDEKTGEAKSEVRIVDNAGVVSGKVTKLLRKGANQAAVCDRCSDDRKDQPITGMEIIRGMKASGGGKYAGGTILKPDEGKVYKSKMALVEGGQKLEVSGCIAFICKSQTWLRQ